MARSYSSLKKTLKKKLKTQSFIWRKKILRDYALGIDIEESNDEERKAEIEKLRKRREVSSFTSSASSSSLNPSLLFFNNSNKRRPVFFFFSFRFRTVLLSTSPSTSFSFLFTLCLTSQSHDECREKKPKYTNRVHTGYVWNKYNRTHYDHDNPPPKFVQGYKFDIFYPDLVDNTMVPTYTLEEDKDSNNGETCIIRFHAGPPYEDIAFRIVNDDWDYSHKNGFKCTFEGGILRLYFNFKRLVYRRWITREGRLLKIARPELWSLIMNLIISELNIHSWVLYLFFLPFFCYWLLKP